MVARIKKKQSMKDKKERDYKFTLKKEFDPSEAMTERHNSDILLECKYIIKKFKDRKFTDTLKRWNGRSSDIAKIFVWWLEPVRERNFKLNFELYILHHFLKCLIIYTVKDTPLDEEEWYLCPEFYHRAKLYLKSEKNYYRNGSYDEYEIIQLCRYMAVPGIKGIPFRCLDAALENIVHPTRYKRN